MRNYFKVAITQRKKPTLFSRIQTALLLFMAGTMFVVFLIFSLFIMTNYDSSLFATKQGEWISCNLVLLIIILLVIFLVVMFLGSLLSYIISKRLSAPLSIIEEHMSQIEVGGENEKINYPYIEGDALSKLVSQYNAMIDKLAVSVEELAQSEREESWRQMARQMAHEIKNPLTPMQLLTQRLLMYSGDDMQEYKHMVYSSAKTLLQGIESITTTTEALSNFAKTPILPLEPINIVESVSYVVDLFRHNEANVNIDFSSTLDSAMVKVDKEMIGHVFNNLLKNAIQAIPDGREGEISVKIYHDVTNVIISVSDNGVGIPDENKDKLFTVNFTTKTKGMGLGLIVVKNVVDQAKGRIEFRSEVDEGSTFFISFPMINV
jgi:nitrogen fixation/metabolism regulation signal transduction histidine kinase